MIDPVNKFASFGQAAPALIERIMKSRVVKPAHEATASAQTAFKEWQKLFKHDILKQEVEDVPASSSPGEEISAF